ncbi:hypothetical protein D3C78_1258210 [compost metagenome]
MGLRHRIQINVAEYAAHSPKILILKPARIRPAIHLYSKLILPFNQIRGNIELGWRKAILTKADKLAVNPHIKSRFNALKANKYRLTRPALRNREAADIRAYRIISCRSIRRLQLSLLHPWIRHICILRIVVSLQLPMRWHGYLIPAAAVIIFLIEILYSFTRIRSKSKFPLPVQQQIVRGFLMITLPCLLNRVKGH